ncbi:MAG: carboxypeptidase-like regulatory domain-containing protein [Muribaculaceae bacterium]|nr:carboxypeptidase-like regulatory domain-containing protein [Muribaculaceae bacterium]
MASLILLAGHCMEMRGEDIVLSGIVKEKNGKKRLPGVSLTVPGSNIGTVSNSDGSFVIKVPDSLINNGVNAEYLGYKSYLLRIKPEGKRIRNIVIPLEMTGKVLDEYVVYGSDPRYLVEEALGKISRNYSQRRNLFTSFYRETIKKGKRYLGISEAIIEVLKNSYSVRTISGDKVRIIKGRRLLSPQQTDTLAVKLMGGPMLPVVLDVVKNEELFFSPNELDLYKFKMEPMTYIDDRLQFVVSFKPEGKADYPLHKGKIYIDRETLSITKTEFNVDVSDSDKATRTILRKKPRGLHFKPQELECVVAYKYQDGVSYLNYIQTTTRFKCDWKRRLFSSGYTISAEMVMVDRDDNPQTGIQNKNAYRGKDVFSDMVDDFKDEDFWKDYNIIPPTESLEKAVLKLEGGKKL